MDFSKVIIVTAKSLQKYFQTVPMILRKEKGARGAVATGAGVDTGGTAVLTGSESKVLVEEIEIL